MKTRLVFDVSPSSGWQLPESLGQRRFYFKVMMLLQILNHSLSWIFHLDQKPSRLTASLWGVMGEGDGGEGFL